MHISPNARIANHHRTVNAPGMRAVRHSRADGLKQGLCAVLVVAAVFACGVIIKQIVAERAAPLTDGVAALVSSPTSR